MAKRATERTDQKQSLISGHPKKRSDLGESTVENWFLCRWIAIMPSGAGKFWWFEGKSSNGTVKSSARGPQNFPSTILSWPRFNASWRWRVGWMGNFSGRDLANVFHDPDRCLYITSQPLFLAGYIPSEQCRWQSHFTVNVHRVHPHSFDFMLTFIPLLVSSPNVYCVGPYLCCSLRRTSPPSGWRAL